MDSKQSRDYKYAAVHGDEPGDVRIDAHDEPRANKPPKQRLLKIAMGSTLIAGALFLAVGYVTRSPVHCLANLALRTSKHQTEPLC